MRRTVSVSQPPLGALRAGERSAASQASCTASSASAGSKSTPRATRRRASVSRCSSWASMDPDMVACAENGSGNSARLALALGAARERLEEREQVLRVLVAHLDARQSLVELRVGAAALLVEGDDVLERGQAAVVHVGGVERRAAQRRRLEAAAVGLLRGEVHAPVLGLAVLHAHAGVVELLVAEVRAGVAAPAAALA